MVKFKIVIPIYAVAAVVVMLLGVTITALINLQLTELGNGTTFKLQLSAIAAGFYALLIFSCSAATYIFVRRKVG